MAVDKAGISVLFVILNTRNQPWTDLTVERYRCQCLLTTYWRVQGRSSDRKFSTSSAEMLLALVQICYSEQFVVTS